MIRAATTGDAQQICEIYNYYIENTIITFESSRLSSDEMKERISDVAQDFPWLVYQEEDHILGYTYASQWNKRCSYRLTAESTVYVRKGNYRRGIGRRLYTGLLNELKDRAIHAVIGGISLPNEGSRRLHERFGFEKVAHFREVGFKFGKWIDVGYWELVINSDRRK